MIEDVYRQNEHKNKSTKQHHLPTMNGDQHMKWNDFFSNSKHKCCSRKT